MPRVNRLQVEIQTGAQGTAGPVRLDFNGHTMELPQSEGGTAAGETFGGSFDAQSFAHSVALVGPADGTWQIARLAVTYWCDNAPAYVVTFESLELDDSTALDIWRPPPLATFDV